MRQKLAVLVIERADDVETVVGEKGEIYQRARDLIHATNDAGNPEGIHRITALGTAGVLKQRNWKLENVQARAPAPAPESTNANDLRAKLKAKGVSVPPRINADTLLALAVEHGVE